MSETNRHSETLNASKSQLEPYVPCDMVKFHVVEFVGLHGIINKKNFLSGQAARTYFNACILIFDNVRLLNQNGDVVEQR